MSEMIREPRTVHDLSELPDNVFGPRDIMWWGTLGFVMIEGFTLVLCAAVYIYLQQNFAAWPPLHTPRPSLGLPTVELVVMLASLPFVTWLQRSAKQFDLAKVRIGLVILALFGGAFVALRIAVSLVALNVKWDTNAYGSAVWLVFGAHFTLLLVEFVEIAGMAAIFWLAPIEEKHFSDAADMGLYWYFMVLAWVPLYILCVLGPRWM
jgi:heme/copper-type cytochrome/quinol oxidase subunit 3